MTDKNGNEIKTGMIVKISNAYCKKDNGLYFVEKSPGDVAWDGENYCLKKISKGGKISKQETAICFWPIVTFMSDRKKNYEAGVWNSEHAEIEVVEDGVKDWSEVRAFFQAEADRVKKYVDRSWWYGWDDGTVQRYQQMNYFYQYVADGLPA